MNYKKYSDEDLFESYTTALDYTGYANKDLITEIESRGGAEALSQRVDQKKQYPKEIHRIHKLVYALYLKNETTEAIKAVVASEMIPEDQLAAIIDNHLQTVEVSRKDMRVDSRTVVSSIPGVVVASIVCGLLWYGSVIRFNHMYYILFPGFLVLSYLVIRLFTRRSLNNSLVFIATFLSTFIGIVLGTLALTSL